LSIRKARLIVVAGLLGCAAIVPALAADAPPGAASCLGCHPAKPNVDTPVPRLAGQDPAAMVSAMQDFRSGKRPATVMDRIAKGFSDDEIEAIAAWYGAQP
jgi:cytochrome subunit of sulfide dehydrogenase